MPKPETKAVFLKDYAPPAFLISDIDLDVDIQDDHARVRSRLSMRRNPNSADAGAPLQLDGDELELLSVALDGEPLGGDRYEISRDHLTLPRVPNAFQLETVCRIRPRENTQLTGLYFSRSGFFTQCETEGFRRITYFVDRPDVMARYTATIRADKATCPVLLSNGNLIASGDDEGGRHWATWEDPFPKPSYLFALVAARLDKLEDIFVTRSGRKAELQIFVEPGKLDQCTFAMQALKRAMRWDEEVFGLELDLDNYKIVAVSDFNMGAMENKGLNIFNTKAVLARRDISTDADYMRIERTIGHEYFHNWTGNRVTCRDWFQLSLKEGLTFFRDQEFGADMYSRHVERIQEVRQLRAAQFAEDNGPMAHPVRPASYIEINNFYTATVYIKGAEVVRMMHTLLGPQRFRKGMDLYFRRHDGQAVTTDDFVQAMQDASGVDLGQFKRWYDQAGTPRLDVEDAYDAEARTYTLTLRQSCPPTPNQPEKLPFHIPFAIGLVAPDGRDMPLQFAGERASPAGTTRILSLRESQEHFRFANVSAKPVPSLLRNFSAPVIVEYRYSDDDLTLLFARDNDPFNRWEAGQRLALRILLLGIRERQGGRDIDFPMSFAEAFRHVLANADADPAFAAEALTLPSETYIAEQMDLIDPDAIHAIRLGLSGFLAERLRADLLSAYKEYQVTAPYSPDARSAGRRALSNLSLAYLMHLDEAEARALCMSQFEAAINMTDAMAALTALADCDCPERVAALNSFYRRWKDEPLVVDKWLSVQAGSRLPGTLEEVRRLVAHPAYDRGNPNKIYALFGSFGRNQVRFNAADGAGYAFMADQIVDLDRLNPQVAARLARLFDRWRRFDAQRQQHARRALQRIAAAGPLSRDTEEVVTKALN